MDEGLISNIQDAWYIKYEDLVFEKEIGRGAFGAVFKGNYLGTDVAIKKVFELEDDPDAMIYIEREVNVLQGMRHPNIVQFMGICNDPQEGLHIITEFVRSGDLRQLLKKEEILMSWKVRVKIAMDIAAAMTYIHSRNIIHRDLKSKNLLIEDGFKVKVCDFGLARTSANRPMTLCGTDDWMAPEVILGMQYNHKADVFSYGIVLAEIITRKKISMQLQRSPMDAFGLDVNKYKLLIPEDCPLEFVVLNLECCAYDPADRPTFKEIVTKLREIYETCTDEPVAKPQPAPKAAPAPVSRPTAAPAPVRAPAAQPSPAPAPVRAGGSPFQASQNKYVSAQVQSPPPKQANSPAPSKVTSPAPVNRPAPQPSPARGNSPAPNRAGPSQPAPTRNVSRPAPAPVNRAGASSPASRSPAQNSTPARTNNASPFGVTLKNTNLRR
eukprot:TRINITY_DN18536_c0_g1_i1.p1 TRINITY_DN18536_c0_g1~~TRINITY_DN18536_c0_g1_i1.p1  ORF type:complete len:450 (-),score=102.93 TRINITY_DN18536_c0_g1_i1:96-1412(-)